MTDQSLGSAAQAWSGTTGIKLFEICVTSSTMAVRHALHQVLTGLSQLSLDAEELGTVELILAEALNNIVEHAYPETHAQGPIHIRCHHKENGLHFTITDQGNPMPNGQIPLGLAQTVDTELAALPEGGYGWFLIKDLAKDIRYQRIGQKNRLDLRIAVAIHRGLK